MSAWLMSNLSTIIITLVLIAIVAVIIAVMRKDRKKCKSCTCGGSCCHCPMAGKCHGTDTAAIISKKISH